MVQVPALVELMVNVALPLLSVVPLLAPTAVQGPLTTLKLTVLPDTFVQPAPPVLLCKVAVRVCAVPTKFCALCGLSRIRASTVVTVSPSAPPQGSVVDT